MRLLLLILACGFFSLGGYQNAYAQNSRTGARSDRVFQRWLPPPEGGQANIADQVRLLELLGSQVAASSNTDPSSQLPLPDLTDDQLRQLDSAYQAWTEQSGGTRLPDWNSLPKEWTDKALANPEQLKQAQRLIEQYARQRKLTQPDSPPGSTSEALAGLKTPEAARPQPDGSFPSLFQDSAGQTRADLSQQSAPARSAAQPTGSPPRSQSAEPQRSSAQRSTSQRSSAQGLGASSAQRLGSRAQGAEAPAAQSEGAEPNSAESDRAESTPGESTSGESTSGESTSGESTSGEARGAGVARNDSSQQTPSRAEPTTAGATSGSPTRSDGPDSAPAKGTLQSEPSDARVLDANGALKQSAPGDAAREPSPPAAASAMERPSPGRFSSPSDASRLTALRKLLEELKAVQASRDQRLAPSPSTAGRSGNHSAGPKEQPSREAGAKQRDLTALERSAQNSARGRGAPPPSMPNNPFHPRATDQSSRGFENRARPNPEMPAAPNADRQHTNSASSDSRDQSMTAESDTFDVSGGQATGASGRDTFDVAPMLETVAAAPSVTRQAGDDALRSSARRAATQRSSDRGSPGDRWTAWRSSASSPRSPAPRIVDLPEAASGISAGLASGSSQSEIQASIKRDIERFGWEKTLRKIIETTFKDETGKVGSSQATSPIASAVGRSLSETRPNSARGLTVDPATAQRSVKALSKSRLAGVMADVWKAIATAPPSTSVASSSPVAEASGAGKTQSRGQLTPNAYQVQIALLVIAAVALAVWIGRKRPAFFRSERVLDARWAEAALAEGIRTRSDVIRAFHRLVAQTAEPVASWWTHRYAARRLVEATPQLATALSDLSSVYEQARYMPPEAELSAEQISRVCVALRACATHGNPTASATA